MLRVLTYHRVADPNGSWSLDPRLISATPSSFAWQMGYVSRFYNVVSMEAVLNAAQGGVPLPRRAVLITFDDAYRDFAEIAWPILKQHRLPATLFVPTAYPDGLEGAFWWDRLYQAVMHTTHAELPDTPKGALRLHTSAQRLCGLKTVRSYAQNIPHSETLALVNEICHKLGCNGSADPSSVLRWEELRRLAKEGVTLGAHTRRHPNLTRLSPGQIREEICGSLDDLKREIGSALPIFSYPYGSHDDAVTRILREAGFVMAFATLDGHNDVRSTDLLRLRRTNITRRTSPPIFALRLLRLTTFLDEWRHRRRRRLSTA